MDLRRRKLLRQCVPADGDRNERATSTSGVIDAVPGGLGQHYVDGFLGATSTIGISAVKMEIGTWNGFDPASFAPSPYPAPDFEIDHVQIASSFPANDTVFLGGSIFINGFSSSPDAPNDEAASAGSVKPLSASGWGSTGSGLAFANTSVTGSISATRQDTIVELRGFAQASQPSGYEGFAFIGAKTQTPEFAADPIRFWVPATRYFRIHSGGDATASFAALTGAINGGVVSPGLYNISFNVTAQVNSGRASDGSTLDWTLQLSPEPIADLNLDGVVDGADLSVLLAGWGTPGADIDGSGTTNGADLAILLATWG